MNHNLMYVAALALGLAACSPSVPAPVSQVPSSLNFSSASLSGNAQVAKGQELTVELRNGGESTVNYELQLPSGDASGLFLDVDPDTAPGIIDARTNQAFKVYFECPVTPGNYSADLLVKYDSKTLTLPVTVQCLPGNITTEVAEKTQVLSPQALALLESYDDATGLLVFSGTAQAVAFKVDDVLVAGPSKAAPDGLLRVVKTVRTENGKTLIDTEEGGLGNAFNQTEFNEKTVPNELQIQSIDVLNPQITFSTQSIGQTDLIDYKFDEVLFDMDGKDSTTDDRFTVNGSLKVDSPEFNLKGGLKVRYKWIKIKLPFGGGFKTKIPDGIDLSLEATAAIKEAANFKAKGNIKLNKSKRIPLAIINYKPIVKLVGYVPVVITHRLTIFMDVGVDLSVKLDYEANQTADLKLGVAVTGSIITPIAEKKSTFNDKLDFSGSLTSYAYVGANYGMKLYGIVGPYGEASIGPKLTANATTTRKFDWKVELCASGKVGINSFKILGKKVSGYSASIFSSCDNLKNGSFDSNKKPIIKIVSKNGKTTQSFNRDFTLLAEASDGDNDPLTYKWSPTPKSGKDTEVVYRYSQPIKQIISVQVDDGYEGVATAQTEFNIINDPPKPQITLAPSTPLPTGFTFSFAGQAKDPNEGPGPEDGSLPCSSLTWSSSESTDIIQTANGCSPAIKFNQDGTRRIRLTAIDSQGLTAFVEIEVTIGTNRPPILNEITVVGGPGLYADGSITKPFASSCSLKLNIIAQDPDGDGLAYTWSPNPDSQQLNTSTYNFNRFYVEPNNSVNPVNFTVQVDDGRNGLTVQSKTIYIKSFGDPRYGDCPGQNLIQL